MRKNFFGDTASDVFDRIKHAVGVSTSKDLAEVMQISESGISNSIKRNSIPYSYCAELAMGLGVPLDWLIFGDVDGDNCHRVINVDYFDRSYQAATFVDDDEQVVSPDFSGNQPDCEYIPLYDIQVSAGAGAEVYGEHVIQRIPFSKSWLYSENLHAENLACLKVAGDSMLPTLDDSDIVLVNHAKTLGDGVFVLRIGNMLRIKRLQWLTGGKLRISSDNPIYEAEQVNLNEFAESEFAILGFCHTKIGRVI